jgi:hypothetical protein
MNLPINAAEWDRECETVVRGHASLHPFVTPVSKVINDDKGELLGTGAYVEVRGR